MERTGKRYGNYLIGLVLLGGLAVGQACSVMEDRTPCPCILNIGFISPENVDCRSVGFRVSSSEVFEWEDTLDLDRNGHRYQVSVPRTRLHVRAWAGDGGTVSDLGLLIPLGQDCPRVYMHDSDIRAEGETYDETVTLRKNHCVMTLVTEGEGQISSDMLIRGNVAGYDEAGRPVNGDFEFLLDDMGMDQGYVAVLPRQVDASLVLEIDDGKGSSKVFALGQYMISSGYDWNEPDLEDVTVTLDYALTELRLVVNGWESVYRYDVEI